MNDTVTRNEFNDLKSDVKEINSQMRIQGKDIASIAASVASINERTENITAMMKNSTEIAVGRYVAEHQEKCPIRWHIKMMWAIFLLVISGLITIAVKSFGA